MIRDELLEIIVVEDDVQFVTSPALSITENLTRNARRFGVRENVITREGYRDRGFGEWVWRMLSGESDKDSGETELLQNHLVDGDRQGVETRILQELWVR